MISKIVTNYNLFDLETVSINRLQISKRNDTYTSLLRQLWYALCIKNMTNNIYLYKHILGLKNRLMMKLYNLLRNCCLYSYTKIKEKRTNFLINLIYLHYIIARYVLTLLTYRCDVHSILELLELFNKFITKSKKCRR